MIENKKDYLEYLECDSENYKEVSGRKGLFEQLTNRLSSTPISDQYYIWRFIKTLRKCEYRIAMGGAKSLLTLYELHKLRRISRITGFQIPPNTIGKGLTIWHWGAIIINGYAKIGDNCILNPNIVIGEKNERFHCPTIGNNVRIGSGARILGDITIGDDVIIGPNAVVLNDIPSHSIVVGVPARVVKTRLNINSRWEKV